MNRQGFLILNYVTVATVASAIITPALPALGKFYQLTPMQVDWIMTSFLLGFMLGQLFYGPFANLFGRVKALQFGLVIAVIGIGLGFLSFLNHSYSLLLVSRFIKAFGGATGLVCTFILLNETYTKEDVKLLFPFIPLFFSVSLVFAIFIGGLIVEFLGWPFCYAALLLHALIMLYCTRSIKETLLIPFNERKAFSRAGRPSWIEIKSLFGFAIVASLLACFTYAYTTMAPRIAEIHLQLNPASYGLWNLVNLVGMVLCALIAGKLMNQWGETKTALLGFFLFTLGLISLFIFAIYRPLNPLWLFLTTTLMYFSAGVIATVASFFSSNALDDKALASSLLNFTALFMSALTTLFIGFLKFLPSASFLITLLVFFFIPLVFFLGLKKQGQPLH